MKLTNFALIFVAILLPIIVLVFVNTSFVVKSEKQEMYYKNLINSAITDAVSSMKHVENEDANIDYGYSGKTDKKVSVNADVAISTFYNSLSNNFNVKNNKLSLDRLKMYIPVVAVLDYDGIYIHSAEENENKEIQFITKPKVYYTYSYVITKSTDPITGAKTYNIVSLEELDNFNTLIKGGNYIYEVNFTMDDYITLSIYRFGEEDPERLITEGPVSEVVYTQGFYLNDNLNNSEVVYSKMPIDSTTRNKLKKDIIKYLNDIKETTIAKIGMEEISYAINKHNDYSKNQGIKYNFAFSVESDAAWLETMDGIGMIAMIQGINLGNRYLNYKAYSASDLILSRKYYVSKGVEDKDLAYLSKNLYHGSEQCNVYINYKNSTKEQIIPSYYSSRADAATQGFYPCPVCKP